ncbi:MAG: DUF4347 domain-containing protein [Burkholderiaceae bacterium]
MPRRPSQNHPRGRHRREAATAERHFCRRAGASPPGRARVDELAPRILYSASAIAPGIEPLAFADGAEVTLARAPEPEQAGAQHALRRELVVIDAALGDYQALRDDFEKQAGAERSLTFLILDEGDDGLDAIGGHFAEANTRYDALHLVGHGDETGFQLGRSFVDNDLVRARAVELAAWESALADQADILIYGCDVAADAAGRTMLENIAALTGADVAASEDTTGSVARGGDWNLEARVGTIDSVGLHSGWDGTLEVVGTNPEARVNPANGADNATDPPSTGQVAYNAVSAVVVWESEGSIAFRIYGGPGNGVSATVADEIGVVREQPTVALADDGSFAIVWVADNGNGDTDVYAQRFDADGTPKAAPTRDGGWPWANANEFRINAATAGSTWDPSLAMAGDGRFVVTWTHNAIGGSHVSARVFDALGNPTLGPADVAVFGVSASNSQHGARVAWDPSADRFGIVFLEPYMSRHVIYFLGVSGDGSLITAGRTFNPDDGGQVLEAGLTIAESGEVVMSAIYDTSGTRSVIVGMADLFTEIPTSATFAVANLDSRNAANPVVYGGETALDVAVGAENQILVSWQANDLDTPGTSTVYIREYDATLHSPTLSPLNVPDTSAGDQNAPSLALWRDEGAIVWSGNGDQAGQADPAGTFVVGLQVQFALGAIVDDDPTVVVSVPENAAVDTPTGLTAKAKDANPGDTVAYAITDANSPFQIDAATGVITVGPDDRLDFETRPTETIHVAAQSSDGSSSTAAFTVDVSDVNDPPVGVDRTIVAQSGTARVLTLADFPVVDQDGPALPAAIAIQGLAGGGSLRLSGAPLTVFPVTVSAAQISGGELVYEAPPSAVGPDYARLDVVVIDDGGTPAATSSRLTIDANAAPVITSHGGLAQAFVSHAENGGSVTTVTASDLDSLTLSYAIVAGADQSAFVVDPATGAVSFQAAPDFESPGSDAGSNTYEVTIGVSDGDGGSDNQTLFVTVTNVDEPPGSADVTRAIDGGTPLRLKTSDFPFSDPEGTTKPNAIRFDLAQGKGALYFNAAMIANGQVLTAAQIDTGLLDYRAPANASGNAYDVLQFTVIDTGGNAAPAPSLLILNANAAPLITSNGGGDEADVTVDENRRLVTTVSASDAEGGAIDYGILASGLGGGADAALFTLDASSAQLRFAERPDFESPTDADGDNIYELTVVATDENGATDRQDLHVRVANVVEPAIIDAPAFVVTQEDVAVDFVGGIAVSVQDPEARSLFRVTLSLDHGSAQIDLSALGPFQSGSGVVHAGTPLSFSGNLTTVNQALAGLRYLPAPDASDLATLEITVQAGSFAANDPVHAKVRIVVNAVNDAPLAGGSSQASGPADRPLVIGNQTLLASDVDDTSSELVYTLRSAPAAGVLQLSGQTLSAGGRFTQADVDAGRLWYLGGSGDAASELIELSLSDAAGARIDGIQLTIELTAATPNVVPPVDGGTTTPPETVADADSTDPAGEALEDSATSTGADRTAAAVWVDAGGGAGPATTASDGQTADAPTETAVAGAPIGGSAIHGESGGRKMQTIVESDRMTTTGVDEARPIDSDALEPNGATRADSGALTDRVWLDTPIGDSLLRSFAQNAQRHEPNLVFEQTVAASSVAVSTGVSIGYVIWLLRGGALLSSIIASMPAWRSIDPLPVLQNLHNGAREGTDEESIESMLDAANRDPEPIASADDARAAELDEVSA